MPAQEPLEEFRKRFPLTKCLVDEKKITYVLPLFIDAYRSAQDATLLIEKLKLPLKAIHYGTNSYFEIEYDNTN